MVSGDGVQELAAGRGGRVAGGRALPGAAGPAARGGGAARGAGGCARRLLPRAPARGGRARAVRGAAPRRHAAGVARAHAAPVRAGRAQEAERLLLHPAHRLRPLPPPLPHRRRLGLRAQLRRRRLRLRRRRRRRRPRRPRRDLAAGGRAPRTANPGARSIVQAANAVGVRSLRPLPFLLPNVTFPNYYYMKASSTPANTVYQEPYGYGNFAANVSYNGYDYGYSNPMYGIPVPPDGERLAEDRVREAAGRRHRRRRRRCQCRRSRPGTSSTRLTPTTTTSSFRSTRMPMDRSRVAPTRAR